MRVCEAYISDSEALSAYSTTVTSGSTVRNLYVRHVRDVGLVYFEKPHLWPIHLRYFYCAVLLQQSVRLSVCYVRPWRWGKPCKSLSWSHSSDVVSTASPRGRIFTASASVSSSIDPSCLGLGLGLDASVLLVRCLEAPIIEKPFSPTTYYIIIKWDVYVTKICDNTINQDDFGSDERTSELLCQQRTAFWHPCDFCFCGARFCHTVQEFEMIYWNCMLLHVHFVESTQFYKLAKLSKSNPKHFCIFLYASIKLLPSNYYSETTVLNLQTILITSG